MRSEFDSGVCGACFQQALLLKTTDSQHTFVQIGTSLKRSFRKDIGCNPTLLKHIRGVKLGLLESEQLYKQYTSNSSYIEPEYPKNGILYYRPNSCSSMPSNYQHA